MVLPKVLFDEQAEWLAEESKRLKIPENGLLFSKTSWHNACVVSRVRFLFCAILLLVPVVVRAQQDPVTLCELPIEFREGLLWMQANVPQSKEPLHFLVDSGANASVVNIPTAKRLGLKLGAKVNVSAVATTLKGHWPLKLSAKAGDIELPGEYLALDLASCPGRVSGRLMA